MTEPAARPRRWWKYSLMAGGIFLAAALAAVWYTTTSSFQNYVRRRVVAEVERITGGRAEIGSFHVIPFRLQVEVRDITVHGKEAPSDIPLAHADSLVAKLKVVSFLRSEFGFHSLVLQRPVVHIAIGPDGATTNVPSLHILPRPAVDVRIQQLFALSIDHLSVHDGELIWADQKIPLDFSVQGADVQMDYEYLRRRYDSHLVLGKVDTAFEDLRPFAWMMTVDFSLGRSFVDIDSLQWNSGRSSLKARGRVSNFSDLRVDGSYEAHVDLEEAAGIARRSELRQGVADFRGGGIWSWSDFSTSGALNLRNLQGKSDQIVLAKAEASADYSLTNDQFKLSKVQGALLGGRFSGDAQVDNWLHSVPPSARNRREDVAVISAARPPLKKGEKPKPVGVQSGTVRLRLYDISIGEVAKALDVSRHPFKNFHPAGSAGGTVDASWKGAPSDMEIAFALGVVPAPISDVHVLPVTAQFQGKYRLSSDSLEVTKLDVATPASRVQASGTLSASSTLHLSVSTSNLEEWRPLVAALGGPTNLPFRVDGNATFNGSAGGRFSHPTLSGTLVAQDFEFTVPATSHTPQQPVHWDSFAAGIDLSPRNLSIRGGSLRRGDTSAEFEVSASLQNGELTENSPYTAHVNLHNVDVAATQALAGYDYPISGTADISLQIAGTRSNPQVQGHIRAVNAAAYGESIEQFDADLRVAENQTALSDIHLTHQDAVVTGSLAYTPATRAILLDLQGKNFDLAQVRQLHVDNLPIEGRGDFTLKESGTLNRPMIDAAVQVRGLTLDHELSGDLDLQATTENGALKVSGHSVFPHGTLFLDGTVGMTDGYPADISARMDHVDLDALWRAYLGHQLTGHSAVSGTVSLGGPLRRPEQWVMKGSLNDLAIDVEYAKLHNQDPVTFTYKNETIFIDPLHMVGEGTDITGHGSIQIAGKLELNLTANGQADLRLLHGVDPNLSSTGLMTIHMTVAGTWNNAFPQGSIQINNGTASYSGLPSGLSEINGSLAFTREHIHIEQLAARTGGGTLDLKGDATRYNQQLNFNLTAVGKDVRLRYPPGVSSTATAELHWVGNRSGSTVSGDILVTKLAVTPGFDFGSYLESSRQSSAVMPANSPLYNVKLDVAIRTAPELQMKTAVARLSGDADLHLRGSLARPSVLGRADILEGDATFNGIKFHLERGDITFANTVAIEPQLNLQATSHVRNYDLDVTVTGTPERLNINYRSEPPLPKSDIIALLALGRTGEESEQLQEQSGQTLFSDEATNLIISQAINSTVSSRLQKLFGVSRIKIDPQGLTSETNPIARGPQITIEQQFANNVTLTYSTNVSQSSEQIIEGEYYINPNISILGTRDQNGVVSFEVRVRRRKK